MINREAGQYLKKENQNKIFDLINKQSYIFLLIGFLMGFTLSYYVSGNETYYVIFEILLIIILTYVFIKFMYKGNKTNKRISSNDKGIEGEKIVAYELDLLRSKYSNFYVINDFQHKKLGNIDHIIISEKGIFTIETKNIKYLTKKITEEHKIKARGEGITLRNLLKDDFGIKYVQALLIYVGNNKYENNKYEKIIPISEIENTINKNNGTLNSNDIEKIYMFLNNKQQKKS